MKFFQVLFFFLLASLSIVSCMIACLWSKLVLATRIISAAAEFVSDTKRIVLVPIFMIIVSAGYIFFWAFSTLWIVSTGKLEDYPTGNDWNPKPFRSIEFEDGLTNKLWIQGFGLFWNIAFLLTLSNFIINGAVCFWYHNASSNVEHPITTSLWWALRYHLGTIAFGSFILAIVWILRTIAEYLQQKQEQQRRNGNDNSTARLILCCIKCILVICEKLIKFINRHSYTETILRSTNFCTSARHAMTLVHKNLTRFAVLHGLGRVVMTFAKLFIILVTLGGAYYALDNVYDLNNESEQESQVNSMVAPLTVSVQTQFQSLISPVDHFLDRSQYQFPLRSHLGSFL